MKKQAKPAAKKIATKAPAKKVATKKAPAKKTTAKVGFMAINHNGTPLTGNVSAGAAQREATTYTNATGNSAHVTTYVEPKKKAKRYTEIEQSLKGAETADMMAFLKSGGDIILPEEVTAPAAPVLVPAPVAKPVIPKHIELESTGKGKRYVSKTEPDSKYHLRDRSDAEKPVSIVRALCEANPTLDRKTIIEACLKRGVNKNTAATQYSLWKAKRAKEDALLAKGDSEDGDEE